MEGKISKDCCNSKTNGNSKLPLKNTASEVLVVKKAWKDSNVALESVQSLLQEVFLKSEGCIL